MFFLRILNFILSEEMFEVELYIVAAIKTTCVIKLAANMIFYSLWSSAC